MVMCCRTAESLWHHCKISKASAQLPLGLSNVDLVAVAAGHPVDDVGLVARIYGECEMDHVTLSLFGTPLYVSSSFFR